MWLYTAVGAVPGIIQVRMFRAVLQQYVHVRMYHHACYVKTYVDYSCCAAVPAGTYVQQYSSRTYLAQQYVSTARIHLLIKYRCVGGCVVVWVGRWMGRVGGEWFTRFILVHWCCSHFNTVKLKSIRCAFTLKQRTY